jgi:phenylalanyl-tRNA synthetase alpha subunit
MTGRNAIKCLAALAALALPAHVAAQETTPAPAAQPAADEAAQIQQRLQAIQQRALQDAALQQRQAAIGEEVVATMGRLDPTFSARAERAQAMQADIAAAQQAEDNARLHELNAEAQELQQAFATARAQAMQDEQVQASLQAFQGEVVAKMIEIEPETETLLARLAELNEQD